MRNDPRYQDLDLLDDYELADEGQDIRGYPLVSADGRKIGVICNLLVNPDRGEVVAVELDDGRRTPVEPLEIHDNVVVYGKRAESYADRDNDYGSADAVEEARVPVAEEKLVIGKRVDEDGRTISVRSRVLTDQVEKDVPLRKEHFDVDRRSVGKEVTGEEADRLFEGGEVSMTERSEEAVVGKRAVVKEEVVVRKTAEDDVEHVSEEVRKTEVDVDQDSRR